MSNLPPSITLALKLYEVLWACATPLLRRNARLAEGFESRRTGNNLPPADLWIQAASAGESYLSWSILDTLAPAHPLRVLITTNTRQGLDILRQAIHATGPSHPLVTADCAYFPLDRPSTMKQAVARVNPRLMVLLETELWPGLLAALKTSGRPCILVNGRITPKSLKGYGRLRGLWRHLGPERILAISREDAGRFAALFGSDRVGVMNNIKFDRLTIPEAPVQNPLRGYLPETAPFVVLGSVREEEEEAVADMMDRIMVERPDAVIGLFPRHLQRLSAWETRLSAMNRPWMRRSAMGGPAMPGRILLWDAFGELNHAYALASAVFVGGSLAPLGGQNFLEPMIHGVVPVIGPYWDNFTWAGEELFHQGLAVRVPDAHAAAEEIRKRLERPIPLADLKTAALRYIARRQGGARQACGAMEPMLMKW